MKYFTGLIASLFVSSAPPYISSYHYDAEFGGWLKIVLAEQKSKKECGTINISTNKMNFAFACNGEAKKGLIPLEKIHFSYSENILSAQNKQSKKNIFSIYCSNEQFEKIKFYIKKHLTNKHS
ncbi:hypothetical protein [Neisseria animaloris]|uniref:hypothetical protein n=1 Tax=Neisseria animaloris TaxID=326522 RepID=UPI0039E1D75E